MSDEAIKYVIFAVILVVAILVTWFLAIAYRKNVAEAKLGKAEDKAREIIDEALKAAEAKKRETLLEAKEEAMKTKNEIDKEVKDRRNELQRMEKRVLSREENLDRKTEAVEKKEASLSRKEAELTKLKQEVSDLEAKRTQELERISGLTSEQAKEYLLKTVEDAAPPAGGVEPRPYEVTRGAGKESPSHGFAVRLWDGGGGLPQPVCALASQ